MINRLNRRIFSVVLLSTALLFTACQGERVCAGLNNGTGTANTKKGVRKATRGGYKSARELEARDRQKKRVRKSKHRAGVRTSGGKNTTGKKGFHLRISFRGKHANGSAHASGGVKF
jgi:hypothetical protein